MSTKTIPVYREIADLDAEWAEKTRALAQQHSIAIVNMIGSPGCGKTALLEATAGYVGEDLRLAVLEGDIATTKDAERLQRCGITAAQLLTDGACHVSAQLVYRAFVELSLEATDVVVVENVGNLVCPACFDVGEIGKIAVLSVTEGEEKPLKYPRIFLEATAIVITKTDLLEHVPFCLERCLENVAQINSTAPVFQVSALKGDGIEQWVQWLRKTRREAIELDMPRS